MFARRQRLSRGAFPKAAKAGKRATTAHFALATSREVEGYAVVVPKQVARLSVTRHRLKRQVAAALRKHSLPSALIVYARAGAPVLSYAEIAAELAAGLSKIA